LSEGFSSELHKLGFGFGMSMKDIEVLGIEENEFKNCLFWLAGRGLGSVILRGG
jgi:hypothetical protein